MIKEKSRIYDNGVVLIPKEVRFDSQYPFSSNQTTTVAVEISDGKVIISG